jgi:hypothetical protein
MTLNQHPDDIATDVSRGSIILRDTWENLFGSVGVREDLLFWTTNDLTT